jgi:TetR/AcrR family transcriptional regulator, transcriptional repressor for nem operon
VVSSGERAAAGVGAAETASAGETGSGAAETGAGAPGVGAAETGSRVARVRRRVDGAKEPAMVRSMAPSAGGGAAASVVAGVLVGQTGRQTGRLTAKGERTRGRIVAAAARLMHEGGVAETTIEDVKAAAGVSSSQLYHYFADKEALVQAVIGHQADTIVGTTEQAGLGTPEEIRAWRDLVVAGSRRANGQGGCPLGSLGGQLAEVDVDARAQVADGFGRWSLAIRDGLRRLHAAGRLRSGMDPDDLAVTLLATLQGGLLLAQVERDTRPLETALDTFLALVLTP